jgi:hypothetical protein
MSTINVSEPELEVDRVEQWRLDSLARAGYDAEAAAVLAASPEVDLHRAVSLVENGCSVSLALQILL